MQTIERLPPVVGVLGGLVGLMTLEPGLFVLCGGGGYFLGKVVQSFVWTVGGTSTSS